MTTFHIEILREHYTRLTSISTCFTKSRIFSNAKIALPLKLYNIKRTLHTTNKEINIGSSPLMLIRIVGLVSITTISTLDQGCP